MMVFGKMIWNITMENKYIKIKSILESGVKIKDKDLAFVNGIMELFMKDNGTMIKEMAKV